MEKLCERNNKLQIVGSGKWYTCCMAISPEFHPLPHSGHSPESKDPNVGASGVQIALALRAFGLQVEDTLGEREQRNRVMELWIGTSLAEKYRKYVEHNSGRVIDLSDPDAVNTLLVELQKMPLVGDDSTIH
jgi:hypothetical protein